MRWEVCVSVDSVGSLRKCAIKKMKWSSQGRGGGGSVMRTG